MAEAGPRIASLFSELLARYPVVGLSDIAFDSWPVRVESNSPEVLDSLSSYYRQFQGISGKPEAHIHVIEGSLDTEMLSFHFEPPEPGKTKFKHAFADLSDGRIVRKIETGMHFLIGSRFFAAVGPCRNRLSQVINFINTRYIDEHLRRGALLCHASGVTWKGRGLTLSGPSGMGKSTLALHLMTHGVSFVSNDRILIDENDTGLRMRGVPKYPRINPGTILNNPNLRGMLSRREVTDLSSLPLGDLWRLERKYDVWIDEVFGPDRFQIASPLSAVVMLNWKRSPAQSRLEPIRLRDDPALLPVLIKTPGVFHPDIRRDETPAKQIERYAAVLDRCRVYRLSGGGDFAPAVGACLELLT